MRLGEFVGEFVREGPVDAVPEDVATLEGVVDCLLGKFSGGMSALSCVVKVGSDVPSRLSLLQFALDVLW